MDLIPNLNEYNSKIASALEEGQLIYITFAGFWEDQSHVPPEYLEVLDSIRQRAKLLIVMGVPTVSTPSFQDLSDCSCSNSQTRKSFADYMQDFVISV